MFEEEGFSEDETEEFSCFPQKSADLNYETAGTEVIVPESGVDLVSHHHLLTDKVHAVLQQVLTEDVQLPFQLADFQKLSLHALGSGENVILVAPTGSGKMLVVWLVLP